MKSILLAEDNPADVYLLREALSTHGGSEVNLDVVSDGEAALEFVHNVGPDGERTVPTLIILDLNLPKSDGSDILRGIRQNRYLKEIPVIVLTSSDSPKDRAAAEKLGASLYLTKPSDLDNFLKLGEILMRMLNYDDASHASHSRHEC